jgi:hypothetical protein
MLSLAIVATIETVLYRLIITYFSSKGISLFALDTHHIHAKNM